MINPDWQPDDPGFFMPVQVCAKKRSARASIDAPIALIELEAPSPELDSLSRRSILCAPVVDGGNYGALCDASSIHATRNREN